MIYFLRFNKKQLDKLSDISSDVGLVALATVVLPAIFDKFNVIVVLSGLATTVLLWVYSLWLKR